MAARSGKLAENRTATEQQFHESDSFAHKKIQSDKIIGKTRC